MFYGHSFDDIANLQTVATVCRTRAVSKCVLKGMTISEFGDIGSAKGLIGRYTQSYYDTLDQVFKVDNVCTFLKSRKRLFFSRFSVCSTILYLRFPYIVNS